MSNYRRVRVEGGTWFFTVVTYQRKPLFASERAVASLRAAMARIRQSRPFEIDAAVILPDHLHCIWTLPEGDADFSGRWREIKKACSRAIAPLSDVNRERKVWQRRFWEHAIRDPDDWARHVDYIHYNPVRHGLARRAADWPWSSFRRFVERGGYPPDWGTSEPARVAGMDLE